MLSPNTKLNSSRIAGPCWKDTTRQELEEHTRSILISQRDRFLK